MNNFSAVFIQRPVATTLLALGLCIAGLVAFNLLPIASLPQIDFPTINVTAQLPGANPETMATSVASPLERQLGRISGITQMTSTSILGSARISLQFDLDRDIDGAARDVQAAINAARSQLPTNLPSNPLYRKANPADPPVLVLSLTSDKYTTGELYDLASSILQQKLSQVTGVGQVILGGSSLPAVRVELNPNALSSYGIGLPAVATAIRAANVNNPKGQISLGHRSAELIANDQMLKAKEYEPLIIAYQNNNPVRIQDVGQAIDSTEDVRTSGYFNGKPAILIVVFKQSNANVIETVDAITSQLKQFKNDLPAAINLDVVLDRTTTIRVSLHDVEFTMLIAMLLVILVTYLFLGSFRAMLIPGVAVPLSLLGTFVIMKFFGYSLDNLSLMALTISTGFVVDDAVVVLENIMRHVEEGASRFQAALNGAMEVSFTVISMSISLIAVFIPILLMGGLVGRLFREFAMTLSIAILISMLVSLTVTPMMCSRLLHEDTQQTTPFIRFMDHLRRHYETSLSWSLRHSRFMLLLTFLALVGTMILAIKSPKEFFPQQDTGQIAGGMQPDQDNSFQLNNQILKDYIDILKADPATQSVVGFIGGTNNANPGTVFITLKPTNERRVSADGVVNRLRSKLSQITGSSLYLQASQDLMVGGRRSNAQFQYTLTGNTISELNAWTPRIVEEISKIPGVVDVNSDQQSHGLQVFVHVNRDTASQLGLSMTDIDQTLYSAFGQRQVSTMFRPMNQYHVVMEVAPKYWQRPETLDNIYVISPAIGRVPLSTIARFDPSATLLSVNHQGQSPSSTISFNLLPGTAFDQVVNTIENKVVNMGLPPTIRGAFQGTAQVFQQSLSNQPYLILAALLAVYIVLGMLYESLIHPITILSTLPSAGLGALLALMLTHTALSLIALIGVILLIGIVKKNAIMMIDFALHVEREQNKSPEEAIFEAAIMRFRPILMTTTAALFGALPLIFGFGLGSELRRPLGIAIVGGLIVSQLLTLYTTPVIYLATERTAQRFRRRKIVKGHPA